MKYWRDVIAPAEIKKITNKIQKKKEDEWRSFVNDNMISDEDEDDEEEDEDEEEYDSQQDIETDDEYDTVTNHTPTAPTVSSGTKRVREEAIHQEGRESKIQKIEQETTTT